MRPRVLAAVAELTTRGASFDRCRASFLDESYAALCAGALAASPTLLTPTSGQAGRVQDACLSATAEELARAHTLALPE